MISILNLLETYKYYTLAAVVLVLSFIRFSGMSTSPPGFFVDEAAAATEILCMADSLSSCKGEKFPIFTPLWGNARVGPVHQYSGAMWVQFSGASIESLRTLSVFYSLLTIFLLSLLAKKIGGETLQFWTVVIALVSPWSFHSSRLAWDPPTAPLFVVATILFAFYAYESKAKAFTAIFLLLSGFSALIAALAYPPVLVQTASLVLMVFLSTKFLFGNRWRFSTVWITVCASFLSIFFIIDTSPVAGRVSEVGIFGDDPRNPTAGAPFSTRLLQFSTNILSHFHFDYIFLEGEYNLRHLPPGFGILTWVDFAIITLCLIALSVSLLRKRSLLYFDFQNKALLLGFFGYLSAVIASSLTWDSIPHALRSIAGWPFSALFMAALYTFISKNLLRRSLILIAVLIYHFYFLQYYFYKYPVDAAWWYDTDVREAAEEMNYKDFQKFTHKRQYPLQAKSFFIKRYYPNYSE